MEGQHEGSFLRSLAPLQVDEFLYQMLQTRHGSHAVIVEFGYNLMEALKAYHYDPDCEMFLKILEGLCGIESPFLLE